MTKIGLRAGITDIIKSNIKNNAITSEANQWKIHKSGEVVATSSNQIFTIEHGLGYAPAFLIFIRQVSNSYYQLDLFGGANYIDKNTLSIQLISSGDKATYLIFKDFGA